MNVSKTITDEIGRIVAHHTFNGAAPYGPGYMLCDGDIVNQTNYDAQHGSGAYVRDQVALSPLNGKYVPNLVSKYLTGAATTTQIGASAITSVGNAGNVANHAHTHTQPTHGHAWYFNPSGGTTSSYTYNSVGTGVNLSPVTKTGGAVTSIELFTGGHSNGIGITGSDALWTNQGGDENTGSSLSSANIRPESIEVLYLIKVI